MRASTFCLSHSAKTGEVGSVGGAPESLGNLSGGPDGIKGLQLLYCQVMGVGSGTYPPSAFLLASFPLCHSGEHRQYFLQVVFGYQRGQGLGSSG